MNSASEDEPREPHAHHGHAPGHKFPAHKWERLVSPERHALLDPGRFLGGLGVRPGMKVADLGAGPGFFTFPLAALVGATGLVYATDVSPDMLAVLKQRGLPAQVRTVLAEESSVDIPDHSVELALLAFVLHEVAHPADFLREASRILRPDGRLVVLECIPRQEEMGPPLHERLSGEQTVSLLERAGFRVSERGEANPSQYFVVGHVAGPGAP